MSDVSRFPLFNMVEIPLDQIDPAALEHARSVFLQLKGLEGQTVEAPGVDAAGFYVLTWDTRANLFVKAWRQIAQPEVDDEGP